MVIGAIILMVMAFAEVGGYDSLLDKYAAAEAAPEYSAFEFDPVSIL
jgi:Sodium:solute symporter family